MPNSFQPPREPKNWSQAFAALPLDAPDASVWPAIAPMRSGGAPARSRRRVPWAVAAALVVAVAVPAAWLQDRRSGESQESVAQATAGGRANADPGVTTGTAPLPMTTVQATEPMASLDTPDPAPIAELAREAPTAHAVATASAPPGEDETAAMPALYAQSARLEAMLTQVRDEHVASGPAAALSLQYEADLASIDAELASVDLHDAQRAALWSDRVGALQRWVDFESTQRWLTAQGERYDGQLVAVY